MSDYSIATLILISLVALAIAAPIWGVDSRDGVDSDQSARRVAWLHGGSAGRTVGFASTRAHGRSAGVLLAGILRSAARRLDQEAAGPVDRDARAAPA